MGVDNPIKHLNPSFTVDTIEDFVPAKDLIRVFSQEAENLERERSKLLPRPVYLNSLPLGADGEAWKLLLLLLVSPQESFHPRNENLGRERLLEVVVSPKG